MSVLGIAWRPLEPPRAPTAVLGEGRVAATLAESVARRVKAGADLRAAHADVSLIVLGSADELPWAPGVTYLGTEAGALLPTTLTPSVPVDLLATAASQHVARHGGHGRRLAILPGRVLAFDIAETCVDLSALFALAEGIDQVGT